MNGTSIDEQMMNGTSIDEQNNKHISINTLVFLDIETTGLKESHDPRITELSLVAVEKEHFLMVRDDQTPRVCNRISLMVNPTRRFDFQAARISGLSNYLLKNQERFDENISEMLSLFLQRLRKPVCLIAHNGKEFDFPILQAELANIKKELPDDLLCVDSLPIFKMLYEAKRSNFDPNITPLDLTNNYQEGTPPTKKARTDISFSLDAIYQRFSKKGHKICHMAEADNFALIISVKAEGKNFVDCIETKAAPFRKILPMW